MFNISNDDKENLAGVYSICSREGQEFCKLIILCMI